MGMRACAGLGPRTTRERGAGLREWAVPGVAGLSAWRDAGWSWAERAGPGERERRRRAGPSAGGKGAGPGERDGPREREGSGWVGLVSWAGFHSFPFWAEVGLGQG